MKKRGVIDDLILYRLGETDFLLVVNASCVEKDVAWLGEHVVDGVMLCNERSEWAGLAIQGAQAPKFFSAITDGRTLPTRNGVDDLQHEGRRIVICRTGCTGEDGFELFCPAHDAAFWWNALLEEKVQPFGLGGRDSLRLEMCYPLNGSDLTEERNPLEAGLGFFASF